MVHNKVLERDAECNLLLNLVGTACSHRLEVELVLCFLRWRMVLYINSIQSGSDRNCTSIKRILNFIPPNIRWLAMLIMHTMTFSGNAIWLTMTPHQNKKSTHTLGEMESWIKAINVGNRNPARILWLVQCMSSYLRWWQRKGERCAMNGGTYRANH